MLDLLKFDIGAANRTRGAFKDIKGDLRGIRGALAGVQDYARRAGGGLRSVGRKMSVGITAPIAGAATMMVKSSLATIDAQAKMAQSIGTSVKSLQVLSRSADMAGISQGELEGSLLRMTRRISLAEQGTGAGAKAFERLRLSAADFADLDVDDRVRLIQSRLSQFIPEAERAGVASQIFGDRTGLAMSRLDAATIEAATREIDRFGVGVSDIDADQIEAANDAMSALGLVTKGLANQLTVALAPSLLRMSERAADLAEWFSGLSPKMKSLIGTGTLVAAALGPAAMALGFMATGAAALLSPIGAVVLGLAAAAGAAAYVVTQWDDLTAKFPWLAEASTRLGNAWTVLKENTQRQFSQIKSIISDRLSGIAALFRGDFATAFDKFESSLGGIKQLVRDNFQGSIALIEALFPEFVQSGRNLVQKISEGISNEYGALRTAFTELKDEIVARLKAIPGEVRDAAVALGRDIISGIVAGIGADAPTVGSTARAAMKNSVAAAKDEVDSNSPSKVFMQIGRDLMAGLGLGIGEKAQTAQSAMREATKGIVEEGKGTLGFLGTMKQSVTQMLSQTLSGAQSWRQSMVGLLSGFSNSLFNSAAGMITNLILPFASGGVLAGGRVQAFANGGVVSGPTYFPMRGGTGLMGEAGPEAILPLTRRGGQLGVRAAVPERGGAGQGRIDVYVHPSGEFDTRVEGVAANVYDMREPATVQKSVQGVYSANRKQPLK